YPIEQSEKEEFIKNVVDRFSNPYIKHQWLSIAVQYSLKMRTRVLPLLLNKSKSADIHAMALGFAAFLRLMKTDKNGEVFTCQYLDENYKLSDSKAPLFYAAWTNAEPQEIVERVFSDAELLGSDISVLTNFKEQVVTMLERIESDGMLNLLKQHYQDYK
ncbi:MAG: hypothetical protein H7Y07_10785, partial [Pyrinomonadaceae bacterium]|nr:hypothetical protein [Sphingobacteriaceae bacterium]